MFSQSMLPNMKHKNNQKEGKGNAASSETLICAHNRTIPRSTIFPLQLLSIFIPPLHARGHMTGKLHMSHGAIKAVSKNSLGYVLSH